MDDRRIARRLQEAIEEAASAATGRVTVLVGSDVDAALMKGYVSPGWGYGPSKTVRFGRGIPVLLAPTMPPRQWRVVMDTRVEGTLDQVSDEWHGILD